ncbi:hypothetical protein Halru_2123 [Halovivax ruber XH-70]|uniref:DUF8159 domain-containing protein n=1 Tax=Halovivax ruber (strain DSM 18193 / JCM 13892 / XH-70) TaxID=797302 RepID=L0IFG5_HALRX|nr:hypothetical protein [Halovivax ruber]AGB16712.1 hypothetical protein Halru_2123 [Halovivax ruber XH-70]
MAEIDRIPFMKSGSTVRNVVVGFIYVFVILSVFGATVEDPDGEGPNINNEAVADAETEAEETAGDKASESTGEETTESNTNEPTDEETGESDSSEPTDEATTEPDSSEATDDTGLSTDDVESLFTEVVTSEGVTVTEVSHQNGELHVEYIPAESSEVTLSAEMGTLAGAYAGLVINGEGGDRMSVTLVGPQGDWIGEYYVDAEWADAWYNGEITDAEMINRIASTIVTE